MTDEVEGVRDPIYVDPECENAVAVSHMLPKGHDDVICTVDDDGLIRNERGEPVPAHSERVVATDVNPDTWGWQYHHPDDHGRPRCEWCTVAVERAAGPEPPKPDVEPMTLEEMEEILDEFGAGEDVDDTPPNLLLSDQMREALDAEGAGR